MSLVRTALVSLAALAIAGSAAADDSGNFLTRLGRDTVGVEHYTRTASRLELDQVGRSPNVLRRHVTFDYSRGSVAHFSLVVTAPGKDTPVQTADATFGPDSMRLQIHNAAGPARNVNLAVPPEALVAFNTAPWTAYESGIMQLVASRKDSLRLAVYFIGATSTNWLSLHRLGRDSVSLANGNGDLFHARIDRTGHVLGVQPIAGTGKFSVERLATLDIEAMAAAFLAREQAGGGLGVLSPRDTVNVANAGGAALWIDYGRPGKRGRAIFGTVVPYGEVWRTGANAATQFKTDKALDFGGTVVPAGFYTLWTLPSPTGWKLIVNSQTGQWGTQHDPAKDLYTIDMSVSALSEPVERFTITVEPSAQGGEFHLDWDTTRASAAFAVKP